MEREAVIVICIFLFPKTPILAVETELKTKISNVICLVQHKSESLEKDKCERNKTSFFFFFSLKLKFCVMTRATCFCGKKCFHNLTACYIWNTVMTKCYARRQCDFGSLTLFFVDNRANSFERQFLWTTKMFWSGEVDSSKRNLRQLKRTWNPFLGQRLFVNRCWNRDCLTQLYSTAELCQLSLGMLQICLMEPAQPIPN